MENFTDSKTLQDYLGGGNKISEKMNQAIVGQQPKTNNQKPLQPINAVAEVSFEQALKELSDLTKNKT